MQPWASVRLAAHCLLETPRGSVGCWKGVPLPARLRAKELTHWLVEAEAQGEGEAVQQQTGRCAYFETSMPTAHRACMHEDAELMAEKHGAMRRRGDLALHFSAAGLRRRCARSSALRRLTWR